MSLRKSPKVLLTVARCSLPRLYYYFRFFAIRKRNFSKTLLQFFLDYAYSTAHAGQITKLQLIMVIAR